MKEAMRAQRSVFRGMKRCRRDWWKTSFLLSQSKYEDEKLWVMKGTPLKHDEKEQRMAAVMVPITSCCSVSMKKECTGRTKQVQAVNPYRQHKIRSCMEQSSVWHLLFCLAPWAMIWRPVCLVKTGLSLVLSKEKVRYILNLLFPWMLSGILMKRLQTESLFY